MSQIQFLLANRLLVYTNTAHSVCAHYFREQQCLFIEHGLTFLKRHCMVFLVLAQSIQCTNDLHKYIMQCPRNLHDNLLSVQLCKIYSTQSSNTGNLLKSKPHLKQFTTPYKCLVKNLVLPGFIVLHSLSWKHISVKNNGFSIWKAYLGGRGNLWLLAFYVMLVMLMSALTCIYRVSD